VLVQSRTRAKGVYGPLQMGWGRIRTYTPGTLAPSIQMGIYLNLNDMTAKEVWLDNCCFIGQWPR
jgi:hypothetical protein